MPNPGGGENAFPRGPCQPPASGDVPKTGSMNGPPPKGCLVPGAAVPRVKDPGWNGASKSSSSSALLPRWLLKSSESVSGRLGPLLILGRPIGAGRAIG